MSFAERKQTAQLNSLSTEDGLRWMQEGKDQYAVDIIFLVTTSFTDKQLGFDECYDLTPMSLQYSDILSRVLVDCRDES